MKKIYSLSMLAIAAMAAFSCAKVLEESIELNQEINETGTPIVEKPLVITAYADDDIAAETKTSLSGVSILWATTDAVAAYTAGDDNPHVSTNTVVAEGGKKATFTFSDLTVGTDVSYLIYPSSAAGLEDAGLYGITLSTEQSATENSFADGANLSLADGSVSADAVQFKNLGALIGIKINNNDIESVRIAADEYMTGSGQANPSDYSVIPDGEKYVKLTGGLDNGAQYYAVVYPSPAEGYSNLQIVAENVLGQTATYSNPNKLVLERNDNKLIADLTIADSKWYPALNTWTYTFTSKQYSDVGALTLNDKTWTLAGTGTTPGYGYDSTKGQQFGTQTKPFSSLTLTSNFGAGEGIKSVLVRASGANGIVGTLRVSVGGTSFKCSNAASVDLSSSATDYYFATPDGKVKTGDIVISMAQTSSRGLYIKTISVNKDQADLSFDDAEYDLIFNSSAYTSFTGQAVNNPHGLSISYESDDTTIATVAPDGSVTLQGKLGTATITATSDETTSYLAGIATYVIKVTDTPLYTANFEGESEHRTSGNNSYTSNSYTVSNVTWNLTKADCVTTGTPLDGSANIICRVKGTNNNGLVVTGDVLQGVAKTVTELDYKSKLGTNVTITVSYSTDNSMWTTGESYSSTSTADRKIDISALGKISHLYLKFEYVTSDTGSTDTNRDSQLDNVIVKGY